MNPKLNPETQALSAAPGEPPGIQALMCVISSLHSLRDTAHSAHDDSAALLAKWHGVDRLSYVITPRFSPTSTPEQLAALGALWREYPDCLMQTHLSEQTDEID